MESFDKLKAQKDGIIDSLRQSLAEADEAIVRYMHQRGVIWILCPFCDVPLVDDVCTVFEDGKHPEPSDCIVLKSQARKKEGA